MHAIALLGGRVHSRAELERKLCTVLLRRRTTGDARALAASVCGELEERGLLDDAAYARWHAAQRDSAAGAPRPRSRAQLTNELYSKGLPAPLVQGAVAGHSELASCAAAALRRPTLCGAQLVSHLQFKGFAYWAVARAARAREEGGEGALRALVEEERAARAAAAAAAVAEKEGKEELQ